MAVNRIDSSWAQFGNRLPLRYGNNRSELICHHLGNGARGHQDDDDLRASGEEPHPGAGGEAEFDYRPEKRLYFADLWDEGARLFA